MAVQGTLWLSKRHPQLFQFSKPDFATSQLTTYPIIHTRLGGCRSRPFQKQFQVIAKIEPGNSWMAVRHANRYTKEEVIFALQFSLFGLVTFSLQFSLLTYYLRGALFLDETVLTVQGIITNGDNNAKRSATYHQQKNCSQRTRLPHSQQNTLIQQARPF